MATDAQQVEIAIQPAAWSDEIASWLARATQHASVEQLRAQVAAGAALFAVMVAGALAGACVLRIDDTADGPEGVIVAAAASVRGVDLVAYVLQEIERKFYGVRCIRVHTARRGLLAKLAEYGYAPAEIVLSKRVGA